MFRGLFYIRETTRSLRYMESNPASKKEHGAEHKQNADKSISQT